MQKISNKYARQYKDLPYEKEDYYNMAIHKINILCNKYNPEFKKYFTTYITEGVNNELRNKVRNLSSNKHLAMNSSSFFQEWWIGIEDHKKIETAKEKNKVIESILKLVRSILSRLEYDIWFLRVTGKTIKEIKDLHLLSTRQVYSALSRSELKIKKCKEFNNLVENLNN